MARDEASRTYREQKHERKAVRLRRLATNSGSRRAPRQADGVTIKTDTSKRCSTSWPSPHLIRGFVTAIHAVRGDDADQRSAVRIAGFLPRSDRPRPPDIAERRIQRGAVPFAEIGRRLVSALQKFQERMLGIGCRAHRIVRQNEFAEFLREERLTRAYCCRGKIRGRRIGVGIEGRIGDRPCTARPEAGTRHFMRIGFLRDDILHMRHAAWMTRRLSARKPRHGEIETAPKEMHRARLAEKARAEMRKDLLRRHKCAPETCGIVRII
jgi:hypothetical protein